jgi:hypothetical protein
MQFCKVEIQLGGDMTNTVIKSGVSVPEIVLLREIHGGAPSVRVISIESTSLSLPLKSLVACGTNTPRQSPILVKGWWTRFSPEWG